MNYLIVVMVSVVMMKIAHYVLRIVANVNVLTSVTSLTIVQAMVIAAQHIGLVMASAMMNYRSGDVTYYATKKMVVTALR
jgi:hypothetical protein